jgi:cytochrome bd-type quinol oxidase subunit 2
MRRLHIWFVLSRLILSPAVVVATVVGLDCGGLLGSVPALAKLVVIVNSALPGALVVVVLLKSSSDLAETASAVARVYLPSYALAIITITGWTAVGMYVTIPDVDGKSFCAR